MALEPGKVDVTGYLEEEDLRSCLDRLRVVGIGSALGVENVVVDTGIAYYNAVGSTVAGSTVVLGGTVGGTVAGTVGGTVADSVP